MDLISRPRPFISVPAPHRNPGRATVEVITPVSFEWFAKWENSRWKKRGREYDAFKASFLVRLRKELEFHVPKVSGKIDYAELSTPLSTRHFMKYQHGEAYGVNPTPARFRLRGLGAHTPIRNLFLTGQDVALLGVTGAMFGGFIAASAILKRNLMLTLSKSQRRAGDSDSLSQVGEKESQVIAKDL